MTEKVHVEFEIADGRRDEFLQRLQDWDKDQPRYDFVLGFRADDYVQRREALTKFVDRMELKLRKNEHKRNWREKPIAALVALMLIEVQEFQVALEHFTVGEARSELPDISNFAMMADDRLSMLDQDQPLRNQK